MNAPAHRPRVVAMGGGRGLTATLRATRRYAAHTTAVVATADDSGSTGRLRSALRIPAPGDLRRCLAALAGAEDEPLGQALEYRFSGTDVEGHALGNLLLAGLTAVTGDFLTATDATAALLGLDPKCGRVVPATVEPVDLTAVTADGTRVSGQYAISKTAGIRRVELSPAGVKPPDGLAEAVLDADQVVLGPGSIYTSILAATLVDDLHSALASTRAQRVYVCNLEPEVAETQGYDVAGHVEALRAHGVEPDLVLVHDGGSMADGDVDARVVRADLARPDPLYGTAHDSVKLAAALAAVLT
ncbi:gluconeogenesis factor YvcK family protein [Streptomyces scabiei]|uniref:gluconeogenesis factor YvcK family protein n=1 Tax=Streptomyces scabiei TaxID=1930 RepID=UPI0029A41D56|nr:gluconeogenesis factor YvcK family protein [Streptomyces scabiei]MDX3524566.1 YvcK family protein [Streptomyces scabiei]